MSQNGAKKRRPLSLFLQTGRVLATRRTTRPLKTSPSSTITVLQMPRGRWVMSTPSSTASAALTMVTTHLSRVELRADSRTVTQVSHSTHYPTSTIRTPVTPPMEGTHLSILLQLVSLSNCVYLYKYVLLFDTLQTSLRSLVCNVWKMILIKVNPFLF